VIAPLWVISAAVAGAVGLGTGWQVQAWRHGAAEKERLEAQAEARRMDEKRASAQSSQYEGQRAKQQVQRIVIREEVERVIDRPVYLDRECLDPDGVRLINAASGAATAASELGAAVPRAAPVD
jgi:hypothetical protein